MKKMLRYGVLFAVLGLATGGPAIAGECQYEVFTSTALSPTDGELGASAGCGIAQMMGLDGACIQNYRDSETGEPCIPDHLVVTNEGGSGETDGGDG